jgi:DNA-binding LacI/PurR family transcriptional regulator
MVKHAVDILLKKINQKSEKKFFISKILDTKLVLGDSTL